MINKREKIAIDDVGEGPIVFLYRNPCGRVILKVATLPTVSKVAGWFMDRKVSSFAINRFVKKNNIDVKEYEERKYKKINSFYNGSSDYLCIKYDRNFVFF